MKKMFLTAAVCMLAVSSVAAQTRNFAGLSLQLDLSIQSTTTKYHDITPSSLNLGEQSYTPAVTGTFNVPMFDSRTLLGMGGTFYLGKSKSGSFGFPGTDFSTKLSNHYALFMAPGYMFSPNLLGYAKLSYHNAKFLREDPFIAFSDKTQTHGFGYGVGVKYKLDRKIFVNFEVEKVDFRELVDAATGVTASFKTSLVQANVGIGYGF